MRVRVFVRSILAWYERGKGSPMQILSNVSHVAVAAELLQSCSVVVRVITERVRPSNGFPIVKSEVYSVLEVWCKSFTS